MEKKKSYISCVVFEKKGPFNKKFEEIVFQYWKGWTHQQTSPVFGD